MKCKINPKYDCLEQYKTGKGVWSVGGKKCYDCEIFQKVKQQTLEVKS